MDRASYLKLIADLDCGKRLPGAVYVYRDQDVRLGDGLEALLGALCSRYQIGPEFNVLKLRTDELRLSFLSYPAFWAEAHPSLRHAVSVDLVTGKARHTDYASNANPPILHRKETFLPASHRRRAEFEALTRAEEEAGLYESPGTIGFKLNWERLLGSKGLVIDGHTLTAAPGGGVGRCGERNGDAEAEAPAVVVERHRTALTRYELSKPVKTLLEYGVLRSGMSFFDYGCGQGSDVKGLQGLGYHAEGWDPVFRPDVAKREADIVNLGYVVNVIEDPAERIEALVDSYRHAKRLLVVSALITETVDTGRATQYRDGVLTRWNTFQKFYDQQELQQFIEDGLEASAVPVGLGVFYVFRDPAEQQDFLSARSRRAIDWTQISERLGLGGPPGPQWEVLCDQHKGLLEEFWRLAVELGRMPAPEEFARHSELVGAVGSSKRGMTLLERKGGGEALKRAGEERRNDLLVYLGLANLRKRVPFGHLSPRLRLDVREFFGNYQRALQQGLELLYAAGDPGEIELACEELKLGWQDEQALYVHRSVVDLLPGVLRAYVGCATALFGDVAQADLVKIHKASGKVTFLLYDDFEGKALPELQHRIKVNLKTRWVQAFDHRGSGQLVYFKERFLAPDHSRLEEMVTFSAKLRKLGITEQVGFGPTKGEFEAMLAHHGLNENLNKRRSRVAGGGGGI